MAALYDAYGRRAYRLALVVLADETAAADAVVEAFRTLRGGSHPRRESLAEQGTLLLRNVYRAATAAHDRLRPHPVGSDRGVLIDVLPPEQRETLLLCMHGVSCAELAATERTTAVIIASRLDDALRHVRDAGSTGPVQAVP